MTVPIVLRELAFWIFFICMLYVFFRKPRADERRREAFIQGIQAGDEVLTYAGLIGTVVWAHNGKVCIASGSEKDHFTVAASDLKKNATYTLRRKDYLKSLTPLQFVKAVL